MVFPPSARPQLPSLADDHRRDSDKLPKRARACFIARSQLLSAAHGAPAAWLGAEKIVYTSRFVRVILAQGPC